MSLFQVQAEKVPRFWPKSTSVGSACGRHSSYMNDGVTSFSAASLHTFAT